MMYMSICFMLIFSLVIQGFKNPLERSSLWSLNPEDKSSSVVPQFKVEWDKELQKAKWYVLQLKKFSFWRRKKNSL